jgi:hypothetical protein
VSTHSYTEELLVEAPAAELFGELGWQTVSALDELSARMERSDAKQKLKSCCWRDCVQLFSD